MRQLVQYKKEVKLQHLTVVQHQKVYDTQRSKMKHMHVNCIKNIILKKKKGRIVQQQKCIVRHGLQSKIKTKKKFFFPKRKWTGCASAVQERSKTTATDNCATPKGA